MISSLFIPLKSMLVVVRVVIVEMEVVGVAIFPFATYKIMFEKASL